MDYYSKQKTETKIPSNTLIIIILIVLAILLFSPSLYHEITGCENTSSSYDSTNNTITINFTAVNSTIGIIFKPYYIITIYDENESIIYSKKTIFSSFMYPNQSKEFTKTIKLPEGSTPKHSRIQVGATILLPGIIRTQ